MKRKLAALTLAVTMAAGLAACGTTTASTTASTSSASEAASESVTEEAASEETAEEETAEAADGQTYTVGICQLVQHPALDLATQGFMDAITDELGDSVTFDNQNAAGDAATASTICNTFASNKVDLILGNATASLQAAASATADIPILGTAITEYGTALEIDDFNGTVGGNISGTSDLAPLDQQAAMFDELLPDAQKIAILYCSAEPNSVYQANKVKECLESAGKTVTVYTFADSNDVSSVTASAASENDAVYVPTDNTAASCAEAINNVLDPAGIPAICGEESMCLGFGIATLSIDYYELGRTTGEMAVRILKGEENISEMPIEYYQNPVKEYVASRCEKLGITVGDDYTAIAETEE